MIETKASRLQALSTIVPVPEFIVIARGDSLDFNLDDSCRYLVRSSSAKEDQQESSRAGQFSTYGPLDRKMVPDSIHTAFLDRDVDEVIVQQYVAADQWGVAFCFSEDNMLIEYSGEFEGVTSGTVTPFTALFPADCLRYQKLEQQLAKIYHRFGPSDIEFVNIDDPRFVQVRPITREVHYDKNFIQLKMQLQELQSSSWRENDVCRILAERSSNSRALSEFYLQALKQVYATSLNIMVSIPQKPFIKISEQIFMNRELEEQITPGFFRVVRLGFLLPGILREIKKLDLSRLSALQLMQKSILVSLAYELFKRKDAMRLREEIRAELDKKLPDGDIQADFHCDNILHSSIEFDPERSVWKQISFRDAQGVIVVDGNFDNGPYYRLNDREQKIPPGVIVITEHLYPEIGKQMSDIRGIICKYGALSAHVAILAREYQVPLIIQTDIDRYE
ncbi:MAG: PEP-utilizing enzyme [Pseudomonadota bacterium]|nr:PEP-utilizing enzyme [Pseudomonadota bacterium]